MKVFQPILLLLGLVPLNVVGETFQREDALADYFHGILQVPIPFANEEDKEKCKVSKYIPTIGYCSSISEIFVPPL
jgi:hypothetical protein